MFACFSFVVLIPVLLMSTFSGAELLFSGKYKFVYCVCAKCGSTSHTHWLWETLAGVFINFYSYHFNVIVPKYSLFPLTIHHSYHTTIRLCYRETFCWRQEIPHPRSNKAAIQSQINCRDETSRESCVHVTDHS